MSSPNSSGSKSSHILFKVLAAVGAGAALIFGLSACTKSGPSAAESKEVNLAIWGNYLSNDLRERFTQETGIKVNVTTYSSNEELLAKIQTGAAGLDVAVPSDYMVEVMAKLELLEPLMLEQVPNSKNLITDLMKPVYDPENRFSLPFAWATTGFAVNRDLFKEPLKSWKDFFENPKLAGKISLMDDVREVLAAALMRRGFEINSTKPEELAKVKEDLLKLRGNVKLFTSDTIDIMKNQEVAVAQSYSSDALQAQSATSADGKKSPIEFVIPEEGASRYVDNLVIVKGAKNLGNAHKLVNFFLSQENNLEFVKKMRAGPVVQGVREKLPEDLKNNPALFPSAAVSSRFQRIKDLGPQNKLYEEVWTAVKTSR